MRLPDPYCDAYTALDNTLTGDSILLKVNQGLYFGERNKTSLLNPQQLRVHGVLVQDNPFHQDAPLGITVHHFETQEMQFLPMQLRGSFAGFVTRSPTKYDCDTIKTRLELTADSPWDPNKINGLPLFVRMNVKVVVDMCIASSASKTQPVPES